MIACLADWYCSLFSCGLLYNLTCFEWSGASVTHSYTYTHIYFIVLGFFCIFIFVFCFYLFFFFVFIFTFVFCFYFYFCFYMLLHVHACSHFPGHTDRHVFCVPHTTTSQPERQLWHPGRSDQAQWEERVGQPR